MHVKEGTKPYQVLPRHVAYALQELFPKRIRLQEQHIIVSVGVKEKAKWCSSFIIEPKPNGTVNLFLDPASLIQALIRPIHRGPTVNDIFPKVINMYYLTLIDASSGYHNLILDKKTSYLTTFSFQFSRSRFMRLPFGIVPAGDMFQSKINKASKTCPMFCTSLMIF